ncbi:Laccase-7 [Nymphaea thermarum]|nr:Laccase-7 [Nymphaea thermarum]
MTRPLALLFLTVFSQILQVENLTVSRLCQERTIIAINKQLPGPIIRAREGDTLVIHVNNLSPYNARDIPDLQLLDGRAELRDTVPVAAGEELHAPIQRDGTGGDAVVPCPRLLAESHREWWNANVVDVEAQALAYGLSPNISDAFTINGKPGHLYPCSKNMMHTVKVVHGKTYLLRIVNAALNSHLFFKVAHHKLTVVGIDATYTEPYHTDFVVIAPGNTVDVLLTADQPPARYYFAARAYSSADGIPFDNTTTTGLLRYTYEPHKTAPVMPDLPQFNDTALATRFYTSLTGLSTPEYPLVVPTKVDEHMFITLGLGLVGKNLAAYMNNVSLVLPTTRSLLEAQHFGISGVYTPDFPNEPPVKYDYTSPNIPQALWQTEKATRAKVLKFNSTVQLVLQNTATLGVENHPIHLHGYNFYVLAQGFGNYQPGRDEAKFNLRNPQMRNTMGVPTGGWAVIRFTADNPGTWIMHCHFDSHLPMGLGTVFLVENGPTPSTCLPPPPDDYPTC